jgi:hypothetical protein
MIGRRVWDGERGDSNAPPHPDSSEELIKSPAPIANVLFPPRVRVTTIPLSARANPL